LVKALTRSSHWLSIQFKKLTLHLVVITVFYLEPVSVLVTLYLDFSGVRLQTSTAENGLLLWPALDGV